MYSTLLKKMIPGVLPLIIFIIADEIWGTRTGLYVALVFGAGELLFYYIREKRIDRFILLDTGLLMILGIVSILLENDLFFKTKPAFIEIILLVIIGFSLWGPKNLIMAMSRRYVGEVSLNEGQEKLMRMNMKVMFWITAVHIVLVLYSAWYMSDKAWAFISGGLYYIAFGLWFAAIWITNRIKGLRHRNEEWFPVVDEEGKVISTAPRSVCHDGKSMLLHPVVHLHLFSSDGMLFLQKRSADKDIQPGKWDTSVGGHIMPGEKVEDALRREASEEIGLTGFDTRFIHRYIWESSRERELVFSFITISDRKPEINRKEVDDGRFWQPEEIKKKLGTDIFTPNFEKEFSMLSGMFIDRHSGRNKV